MQDKSAVMVILFSLLVIVVAGCSMMGPNQNNNLNPYEKYYTGTQGIVMNFASGTPTTMQYYGPDDQASNDFNIGVEIRNQGASFSRGGVYLSGFDPHLLMFREVPVAGLGVGACGLSIGNVGFGVLGGILHCDGIDISAGSGVTNVNIGSWDKLITGLQERFPDKTWLNGLDPKNFDLGAGFTNNPTGSSFVLNVKNMAGQVDYYGHGRLFIAWLLWQDFTKNGGQEFLLAGNSYDFPGGEYKYQDYNGQIIDWPTGLDQTTQHLLLTSCYQYTTFADPIVCVDPDPMSDNYKVCRPQSRTYGGGNGAPVEITSIEQENSRKNIIFHINIKNVGSGTVYDPGKLEKCSPWYPARATPDDLNIVLLGDVRIGTVGLRTTTSQGGMSCSPQVIRLDPKTKTGTSTCTYPLDAASQASRSAFSTPLVVELWYGYSQVLNRDITIKRVT